MAIISRGEFMVFYDSEAVLAAVLRRRRVRLRFGLAGVSGAGEEGVAAGTTVGSVVVVGAGSSVAACLPWSICKSPTDPLSNLTEGCLAIGLLVWFAAGLATIGLVFFGGVVLALACPGDLTVRLLGGKTRAAMSASMSLRLRL